MIENIILFSQAIDNKGNNDVWINGVLNNDYEYHVGRLLMDFSDGTTVLDDKSTIVINGNDFMIKLSSNDEDVSGRMSPILICGNKKIHDKKSIELALNDFIDKTGRGYNVPEINFVLEKLFSADTDNPKNNLSNKKILIISAVLVISSIIVYKLFSE